MEGVRRESDPADGGEGRQTAALQHCHRCHHDRGIFVFTVVITTKALLHALVIMTKSMYLLLLHIMTEVLVFSSVIMTTALYIFSIFIVKDVLIRYFMLEVLLHCCECCPYDRGPGIC